MLAWNDGEGEAARTDGRQKLLRAIGSENKKGVVGRFFEGFKESVGRFRWRNAHALCLKNESDLEGGTMGATR
jgi:hypothetical protein